MIWEVHRESEFFSIPDLGVKKAPDPDPQHWSLELNCMLTKQKSLENRERRGTDEIHGGVGLVVGHARQGDVEGRLAEGPEGKERLQVVTHTAVRGTLLLHPPAHQQPRHKCQAGAGLTHFNAGSIRHLKTLVFFEDL